MLLYLALLTFLIPLFNASSPESTHFEEVSFSYRERIRNAFLILNLKSNATIQDLKRAYLWSAIQVFTRDVGATGNFEKLDKLERDYLFLMNLMKEKNEPNMLFEKEQKSDVLEDDEPISLFEEEEADESEENEEFEDNFAPTKKVKQLDWEECRGIGKRMNCENITEKVRNFEVAQNDNNQFNLGNTLKIQNLISLQTDQVFDDIKEKGKENSKEALGNCSNLLSVDSKNQLHFLRLDTYLTPSDLDSAKFKKEFYYQVIGGPRIPVQITINTILPAKNTRTVKKMIVDSFKAAIGDSVFGPVKIVQYLHLETEENLISEQHFLSRLKYPEGTKLYFPNVLIVKMSEEESLTGFNRIIKSNKYGLFCLTFAPVEDYTLFDNLELQIHVLVVLEYHSRFSLQLVSNLNPKKTYLSTPINSNCPVSEFFGNWKTYSSSIRDWFKSKERITYSEGASGFNVPIKYTRENYRFQPGQIFQMSLENISRIYKMKYPKKRVHFMIERSPYLVYAAFYKPLRDYAKKENFHIGFHDLVITMRQKDNQTMDNCKTETNFVIVTGRNGVDKFGISVPKYLESGFYFIKGLGDTIEDYLILHLVA